ncbi:hypothetical protein BRAS3809_660007 [Bradyrhizobium sp. STM 3809]|nr:hypothetical protein BRAS3809_660007 [Bradyrhizobium sp. STM 3809]
MGTARDTAARNSQLALRLCPPYDSARIAKRRSHHVIASAAKQSSVMGETLDCFVASLLAMTW